MPVASPLTSTRAFVAVCLAALALYAIFVAAHSSPVAAGSDSAGYLLSAQLLTEGRLSTPLRTLPEFPPMESWEYTPLGMIYSERLGELIPTYPIGLPLFYALASTPAGWTWGPVLVAALLASGAVAFTFLVARELGVRAEYAALAATALAVCPLVFYTTFLPLSDTATTCWNAAAIFCALRAHRTMARRWGFAAGAAFAVTVLIRPANMLLLPALVVLLGSPRLLIGAFLGGLPGAIFLGWYHQALYGSVLVTGYGSVWGMFGSEHVAPSLHKYLFWIPAFAPLTVLAVVLAPWLPWRTRWREITALLLWIVAYGGFYAFYPPTHENRWYLRFVLPMFPALLALAALALESALRAKPDDTEVVPPDDPRRSVPRGVGILELARVPVRYRAIARSTACALALGISLGAGWHHWRSAHLGVFADSAKVFQEIPTWVDASLPDDAIILTLHPSCSFYFYTDRTILRSDVIKPARFTALAEIAASASRPVYAIVTRGDDEPTFKQRLPGEWIEEKRFGDFGVWRLGKSE